MIFSYYQFFSNFLVNSFYFTLALAFHIVPDNYYNPNLERSFWRWLGPYGPISAHILSRRWGWLWTIAISYRICHAWSRMRIFPWKFPIHLEWRFSWWPFGLHMWAHISSMSRQTLFVYYFILVQLETVRSLILCYNLNWEIVLVRNFRNWLNPHVVIWVPKWWNKPWPNHR